MHANNPVGRAVSVCLVTALGACTATRPIPPPLPPPAVVAPSPARAAQIPGTPVVLSPEDKALGYFLKSQVALNDGDYATALTELEQAVKNDPDSPFLRLRLATLAVRQGKLAEALEHCKKVVASEPDNVDAQLLLAGLLSSSGKETQAAQVYEALLKHEPDNQEPYLYLGTLYAKQEEFQKATAF